MPAHVAPTDYPSSWTLQTSIKRSSPTTQVVTGAVFKDGVYEEAVLAPGKVDSVSIRFPQYVAIAELEVLGTREALDSLWLYGQYPCSQRHAVITTKWGPTKIFARSEYATPQEDLRKLFDATEDNDDDLTSFFVGAKPVIIGAELPELPMVHEVVIHKMRMWDDKDVAKVVLQGSFCQPHCNKFGSKGWVRLGVRRVEKSSLPYWYTPSWFNVRRTRILVANPGKYKAYRLKFIPVKGTREFKIGGVYSLGCTARAQELGSIPSK